MALEAFAAAVSESAEKIGEAVEVTGGKIVEKVDSFDPDKRIDVTEKNETPEKEFQDYDPDKRIDAGETERLSIESEKVEPDNQMETNEYNSTYKERFDRTPTNGLRGEWTGDRAESKFVPRYEYMKVYLKNNFGLDGIDYKNGIPDFSKCAESTVQIDKMSKERYGSGGNFEQCDSKCAEKWNQECKDGRTDWTARDVADWRSEHKYSWHERNDMKTCDLVPTKVNDYFGHLGGVAECKKAESNSIYGGGYDD